MLEGLYSAASGMSAQQQRLDALSNDVANVNTPGYKRLRVSFRDLAYEQAGTAATDGVQRGAGAAAAVTGRSALAGVLQQTGRPLDVAIEGPGFLRVRREDGSVGLTRDGSLEVASDGRLTTADGHLLDPPVTLPQGTDADSVTIGPDGTVTAAGRAVGRIELVDVPAPNALLADGDGLLVPTVGSGAPRAATGSTLEQGVLEGSNVELADAMIAMIEAQRAYALSSRAVATQDQLLEIANGVKR